MAVSSILVGVLSLIGVGVGYAIAYYLYKCFYLGRQQNRRQGRQWYGHGRGFHPEHGSMPHETWTELQQFFRNPRDEPEPEQELQPVGPRPMCSQVDDWFRQQDRLEGQYEGVGREKE